MEKKVKKNKNKVMQNSCRGFLLLFLCGNVVSVQCLYNIIYSCYKKIFNVGIFAYHILGGSFAASGNVNKHEATMNQIGYFFLFCILL